jgi:hypothetical protein
MNPFLPLGPVLRIGRDIGFDVPFIVVVMLIDGELGLQLAHRLAHGSTVRGEHGESVGAKRGHLR